jgi:chromosomal replication initiator protein
MAAYLLREECRLSTKRVGEELGGKDHSTVIYAQRKFEQEMASDSALRRLVAEIRRALSTSG